MRLASAILLDRRAAHQGLNKQVCAYPTDDDVKADVQTPRVRVLGSSAAVLPGHRPGSLVAYLNAAQTGRTIAEGLARRASR